MLFCINIGAEWLLSVNLSLIKNEKIKLAQEFFKLVPMTEVEQQEIFLTLQRLLESKVFFFAIKSIHLGLIYSFYLLSDKLQRTLGSTSNTLWSMCLFKS